MDAIMTSLLKTANDHGLDNLVSLANWLPVLLRERDEAHTKIREATNCLVCAGIGDPMLVCQNTLALLDDSYTPDMPGKIEQIEYHIARAKELAVMP